MYRQNSQDGARGSLYKVCEFGWIGDRNFLETFVHFLQSLIISPHSSQQADVNYVNKLDSSLSALHIQSLGGVASLHELAGDGVEGPRALVQLLDGVELQGLRRVVDQEGVGLDIIRVRDSNAGQG